MAKVLERLRYPSRARAETQLISCSTDSKRCLRSARTACSGPGSTPRTFIPVGRGFAARPMDFGGMAPASAIVGIAVAHDYDSIRPVKRSWALLGSNPTRNSRADGAPQARGPAGESPQAPFINPCHFADAGAMPPKSRCVAASDRTTATRHAISGKAVSSIIRLSSILNHKPRLQLRHRRRQSRRLDALEHFPNVLRAGIRLPLAA
jgi:hypothetical protein